MSLARSVRRSQMGPRVQHWCRGGRSENGAGRLPAPWTEKNQKGGGLKERTNRRPMWGGGKKKKAIGKMGTPQAKRWNEKKNKSRKGNFLEQFPRGGEKQFVEALAQRRLINLNEGGGRRRGSARGQTC